MEVGLLERCQEEILNPTASEEQKDLLMPINDNEPTEFENEHADSINEFFRAASGKSDNSVMRKQMTRDINKIKVFKKVIFKE